MTKNPDVDQCDERQGIQFIEHTKTFNTRVGKPKDIAACKGFGQTLPVWSIRPRSTEIDAFAKNGCRYFHRFVPRVEIRERNSSASCTKQALKQLSKHSPFTLDPRI